MNRFFDENLIKLKIGKKKLQIEKRANEHNRTEKQQTKNQTTKLKLKTILFFFGVKYFCSAFDTASQ